MLEPGIIGARVEYLESSFGPAKRVQGDTRFYVVDGCDVEIGTDGKGSINWFGFAIAPQCAVDLGKFVARQSDPVTRKIRAVTFPTLQALTFGEFLQIEGSGTYMADCLGSCGNSSVPSIFVFRKGSHADNYMDILLGRHADDGLLYSASDKWENDLRQRFGEAFVSSARFNCGNPDVDRIRSMMPGPHDVPVDAVAQTVFADTKIDYVRVGTKITEDLTTSC